VEDPIEYQLKGINQIQVKPQIGLNFAGTLRHIVRHDPDIIMIGRFGPGNGRDRYSIGTTGHLVFTLHTNDAPKRHYPLLGVENFLPFTLRVFAQRLVRATVRVCKPPDLGAPLKKNFVSWA
jgi:type II secretory ATPase GspE/PulE/Tfp pilus assembly ATPase PilB-like protein